jgi:hypothetical protein
MFSLDNWIGEGPLARSTVPSFVCDLAQSKGTVREVGTGGGRFLHFKKSFGPEEKASGRPF